VTSIDLAEVRSRVLAFFRALQDREGLYGCIRMAKGKRPDLYSSVDYAIARTIMGEDLMQEVKAKERAEWTEHINSFAEALHNHTPDGSYFDCLDHGKLHANGQVISALGVIGGKQKYVSHLYDDFDTAEKIGPWLDSNVDWTTPWGESHKFWGGVHCFSRSKRCPPDWLDACFAWLDANVDPDTGFWRRGVRAKERIHYLGGAVHILPIYEHRHRPFPCPRQLADSVLDLQRPEASWLDSRDPVSYMDLDALYVFHLIRQWLPVYRRADIQKAVDRYTDTALAFYAERADELYARHPHFVLAAVGIFGLLSRLNPKRVQDSEKLAWSDIFSDDRFHQTCSVEMDEPVPAPARIKSS